MKREHIIGMHKHCILSAAANRRANRMNVAAEMLVCARGYRTWLRMDADLPGIILNLNKMMNESECSEIHSDEPISWDEFAGNHM
ncbi:hypothetical protein ABRP55_20345 [Pectobacterium zantedeschiae]|uniref:hypothetical protein n=1 Tax=Pectobacterium zantedeschiae TaxID=2034769 RepID=UPI0032F087DE